MQGGPRLLVRRAGGAGGRGRPRNWELVGGGGRRQAGSCATDGCWGRCRGGACWRGGPTWRGPAGLSRRGTPLAAWERGDGMTPRSCKSRDRGTVRFASPLSDSKLNSPCSAREAPWPPCPSERGGASVAMPLPLQSYSHRRGGPPGRPATAALVEKAASLQAMMASIGRRRPLMPPSPAPVRV